MTKTETTANDEAVTSNDGLYRALCKWRGALVIAEFRKCQPGQHGKCPECGGTIFTEHHGWVECEGECGFAINAPDLDAIRAE